MRGGDAVDNGLRGKEWDNGDEWGLIISDLVETGEWRETLERGDWREETGERGERVESGVYAQHRSIQDRNIPEPNRLRAVLFVSVNRG